MNYDGNGASTKTVTMNMICDHQLIEFLLISKGRAGVVKEECIQNARGGGVLGIQELGKVGGKGFPAPDQF